MPQPSWGASAGAERTFWSVKLRLRFAQRKSLFLVWSCRWLFGHLFQLSAARTQDPGGALACGDTGPHYPQVLWGWLLTQPASTCQVPWPLCAVPVLQIQVQC